MNVQWSLTDQGQANKHIVSQKYLISGISGDRYQPWLSQEMHDNMKSGNSVQFQESVVIGNMSQAKNCTTT